MHAYELRFRMLEMSRNMLEAEYHAKASTNSDPVWPTLEDIVERARTLNNFVSEK
jgi:hypothetical protein